MYLVAHTTARPAVGQYQSSCTSRNVLTEVPRPHVFPASESLNRPYHGTGRRVSHQHLAVRYSSLPQGAEYPQERWNGGEEQREKKVSIVHGQESIESWTHNCSRWSSRQSRTAGPWVSGIVQ